MRTVATLDITVAIGGYAGSTIRALAKSLEQLANNVPDQNGSGASVVLRINNAPATGVASVALQSGPYTSDTYIVG